MPGDYATIQTAVDALAATGQDATICLGGATFTESTIFIRDNAAHGKTLQIVGESADRSTINAEVYVLAGWSRVTFRGVHISVPSNRTALRSQIQSGGSVKVLASRLSGQTGLDA